MLISKHCAKCGISIKVVSSRVKDKNYCSVKCANIDRTHGLRRKDISNEQIASLYINEDLSTDKIAELLGVSKSTVCRRIKKLGLTKSPYGHNGRNGKRGIVYVNGYPAIYAPEHPRAKSNGYVREHIIIAEEMLSRPLVNGEVVHHINEDKTDNRPENLMVFQNNEEHMRFHWKMRTNALRAGIAYYAQNKDD